MTIQRRYLKVATFATALASVLLAMPANAGTIQGRITDKQEGNYLTGVQVEISSLQRRTITDREGRFTMTGIPEGEHSLFVRYIGFDPVVKVVNVPDEGSTFVGVEMGSEVFELAAFEVEGYLAGQAAALQQKRTSDNFMEIVSADAAGNLPDRNVADALSRLPGVSLDSDAGEGRFVTIRGIDPNLNNVTLNGASLAAPGVDGRSGRSMPLDVIGSAQISQLEVIKTVTPDLDANSLGGTINVRTASGFDRPARYIAGKVEVGEARENGEGIYGLDFTFTDVFGEDDNVGLAFAANYSERPYISQEIQAGWSEDGGRWYVDQLELAPREGDRERLGVNLNLDFRPSDDFSFYIHTLYNDFSESIKREEYIIEARRDPEFLSDTLTEFNRMRFSQRTFERIRDQGLQNITVGGRKDWDLNTLTVDYTYSYAEESVPVIEAVDYRTGNINYQDGSLFQIDFSGYYPNFIPGRLPSDYDEFGMRRLRTEDSLVEEELNTLRIDYRRDFENLFGDMTGYIKTGVKLYDRSRFVDDNSIRPVADVTMADVAVPGPGYGLLDGRYFYPGRITTQDHFDFLDANPGLFEIDEIESQTNSVEDDYDINEEIRAIYAMANVNLTSKLTMIGGVRLEETDAEVIANEVRFADDGDEFEGIFQNSNSFDYSNVLPNLQLMYKVTENSVLRAAITGTIGRPAYEDAAPISVLEYVAVIPEEGDELDPNFPNVGSLEIGNPNLSPYESLNFDLSYEYYFPKGGMLSVAIFDKQIDNPIYIFQDTQEFVTYNGIGFEELDIESYQNADSGTVTGLELNAHLPFRSFWESSELFNGFGIDANASFFSSEAEVFDREDEIPFFRQPDLIYNLGLYYEKYGFYFRAAYKYQSESILELSDDPEEDFWEAPAEYVDLQASYQVNDHYKVFVNWQNVYDESKEIFYGRPGRVRRAEYFGSNIRAGVNFVF